MPELEPISVSIDPDCPTIAVGALGVLGGSMPGTGPANGVDVSSAGAEGWAGAGPTVGALSTGATVGALSIGAATNSGAVVCSDWATGVGCGPGLLIGPVSAETAKARVKSLTQPLPSVLPRMATIPAGSIRPPPIALSRPETSSGAAAAIR